MRRMEVNWNRHIIGEDRTKEGPTYHIDYIFGSQDVVASARSFEVGTFEDWVGNKLSDHVPLVLEIA